MSSSRRIYVGSFTDAIYTLEFHPSPPDSDSPTLKFLGKTHVGPNPSWIARHPSDNSLVFTGLEQENGEIAVIKYGQEAEGVVIARAKSGGSDPCSLLATEDELLIGNYSSGTIATLPISTEPPFVLSPKPWTLSMPFERPGPNKARQACSHPHQVIFSNIDTTSAERELLVPDLGADKVWRLKKGGDGRWTICGYLQCESGGGPRHVVTCGKTLYTLLELTSKISVHSFPPTDTGPPLKWLSTLQAPPPPPHSMTTAEILLPEPNATFSVPYIYVSNRDDPNPEGDTIAIFSLANGETEPELVTEVRTGLNHLRGMSFGGEDNKWLIAGGVEGGGVKIFERVHGGKDLRMVASLGRDVVPRPTSFLWA
ncbi:Lactonase, 7-bladed beta-propeller-domain-containing protein [Pisolithus marmoratus]|nr:Lactonase, 7-bladed beta-propeller-domain-containing protein [Pisolithus marmoratus]